MSQAPSLSQWRHGLQGNYRQAIAGFLMWKKDIGRTMLSVTLCSRGVDGYPEGTFLPEHPITRTEAVKVINRLLHRVPDVQAIQWETFSLPFGDVPQDFWGYAEIAEAAVAHQYEKEGEAETWTEIVQGT